MLRLINNLSVRSKLIIGFSGLILCILFFVVGYYPARQAEEFLARLEAEATAAANLLAYHLSPSVEFEDKVSARKGIQGVEQLKDTQYVGVFDLSWRSLAEQGHPSAHPRVAGDLILRQSDRLIIQRRIFGIQGEVIGHLIFESSLARLEAKHRQNIKATGAMGALILVLGLAVALVLHFLVVLPIVRVTRGVDRIAKGDLDAPAVRVTGKDEVGQLAAAFNTMRDELKRTTVSKSFLNNILASMADMMLVLTPEGAVQSVNRAALDCLEGEEDELLTSPLADRVEGDLSILLATVIGRGRTRDHQLVFKSKSGKRVPVVVNGSRVVNAKGDLEAIVLVARDMRAANELITATARAEVEERRAQDLTRAYTQLDQAHQELKTAQAQLVQSGKLAAVGELAAGVAHEINNPLSAVLTYAILLNQKIETLPPALQLQLGDFPRKLGLIKIGAERCKSISDNLLTFARESPVQMESLRVVDILDKAFNLIGTQLRLWQVTLKREVSEDFRVWGNDGELQQVLINLMINGAQAMAGGGELEIRAFSDGKYTLIEVTDQGKGIPPEDQERIFNPFFTTKGPGEGTGLGLSIVHGIIKKHNGKIDIKSAVDQGTTFRLIIPAQPRNIGYDSQPTDTEKSPGH